MTESDLDVEQEDLKRLLNV